MHKKTLLSVPFMFSMVILFAFVSGPFASDIPVTASGLSAIMDGNIGKAKESAMRQALRDALEQGAGVLLDSSTIVKNFQLIEDNIYLKARGFITGVKILKEGPVSDGKYYEVKIRATVSRDKLISKLETLNILHKQSHEKSIIILYDPRAETGSLPMRFNDKNEREVILSTINTLNEEFLSAKFQVFDQDRLTDVNNDLLKESDYSGYDDRALRLAQKYSADLVAVFRLFSSTKKDPSMSWAKARIMLKLLEASTGKMIGATQADGEKGFEGKAGGYEMFTSLSDASRSAAMQGSKKIIPSAVEYLQEISHGARGEKFRLVFSSLSIRQKRAVKKNIGKIEGYMTHKVFLEEKHRLEIEMATGNRNTSALPDDISEVMEKDPSFDGMLLDSERRGNLINFRPVKE